MVDPKILIATGATHERLQQIFTAKPPERPELMSEEEVKAIQRDYDTRKAFEGDIARVLMENVNFTLNNYPFYGAVDLAWDAPPINKETYPLLLYAQGKLDLGKCVKSLTDAKCADRYVKRDDKGQPQGIDLPKFVETNFNLVRSMVTRRLAAQSNKYSNLFPHYKYESRSVSQVAKLRADVMSQIMDIMADQFDYRHHEVQVMRDMLLYGHSVDFIRSSWERELQWRQRDPSAPPETKDTFESTIVKEGLSWVNPHPSRVFWDTQYPLSTINTDTGCEYFGFWDVVRYGDVSKNTRFWNRANITWSSYIVQLFSTYAQYFSQYYCTISPPCDNSGLDLSSQNDRQNNIGLYSQDMTTTSMIIAQYFKKIIPRDWNMGDYPYPVWLRIVVAGYNTVIFAEFLPSTPGAYCGYNENDSRFLSLSVAHELMSYQDQMTNLLSMLLLSIKADNHKVLIIDIDLLSPEQLKTYREQAKGKNYYNETQVIEVSGAKMKDLGLKVEDVIKLVETRSTTLPTVIFQAMAELVRLSERLMALSPQEQGQPAPSGISATETNMLAGTTETVYGFISGAIDEYRAAKKRICYESYQAFGNADFEVPVLDRYPQSVIVKAGFKIRDDDQEIVNDPNTALHYTVIGTKQKLVHDYIFTSRDGADRSINSQAANTLVQLLGVLQAPQLLQAITKEKLYEIFNEIFRLSGAGVDLRLELREGEPNTLGIDVNQQVQEVLKKLTDEADANNGSIQKLTQQVQSLMDQINQIGPQMKQLQSGMKQIGNGQSIDPVTKVKAMRELQKMEIDKAKFAQDSANDQQEHDHNLAIKSLHMTEDIQGKRTKRYAMNRTAS